MFKIEYYHITAAELAAAEAALGAVPHDYIVRGPFVKVGQEALQRTEPAGSNRGDGTVKP